MSSTLHRQESLSVFLSVFGYLAVCLFFYLSSFFFLFFSYSFCVSPFFFLILSVCPSDFSLILFFIFPFLFSPFFINFFYFCLFPFRFFFLSLSSPQVKPSLFLVQLRTRMHSPQVCSPTPVITVRRSAVWHFLSSWPYGPPRAGWTL